MKERLHCFLSNGLKEAPEGAVDSNTEGVCSVDNKSEVLINFIINNNFMPFESFLIASISFHCRSEVVDNHLLYSSVTV